MKNLATGHTTQYGTLARALGYAAGLMEDDLEELVDHGDDVSAASLRIEARFVTVVLLAGALAEAIANAVLALATDGTHAKAPRKRRPTLFVRWADEIPAALGCEPFLTEALKRDVTTLSDIRNAITHSTPRLFVGETTIDHGNTERWLKMTVPAVRMCVALPLRLAAAIPLTSVFQWPICSFVNDYWLSAAICRGNGERAQSPNEWRPATKERRARRQAQDAAEARDLMAGKNRIDHSES